MTTFSFRFRSALFLALFCLGLPAAVFCGGKADSGGTSVSELQKAAEKGDPESQYNLGVCYEDGDGVPRDAQEAVKWYRKAADQNFALAQNKIGRAHV